MIHIYVLTFFTAFVRIPTELLRAKASLAL